MTSYTERKILGREMEVGSKKQRSVSNMAARTKSFEIFVV